MRRTRILACLLSALLLLPCLAACGRENDAERDSYYIVHCVDQHGAAVPGCVVNFCTDRLVMPVLSDESGAAVFDGEPDNYRVQVVSVPEGYFLENMEEFTTVSLGQELTIRIHKQ